MSNKTPLIQSPAMRQRLKELRLWADSTPDEIISDLRASQKYFTSADHIPPRPSIPPDSKEETDE